MLLGDLRRQALFARFPFISLYEGQLVGRNAMTDLLEDAAMFRKFGVKVDLNKMSSVPMKGDYVHGRNAAMGVSGHVVVSPNHQIVRLRVE